MRHALTIILTIIFLGTAASAQTVRIKDIATIDGVRANQLIGYGLVVGLEGTGDSQQTKFTTRTLANLLDSYGINVPADKLKVKNVAAVMVTASLPPFARPGTTIDVVVSSLGDARTLQGGTLLQTPLRAANGEVYAAAQGQVSIGGFSAGRGGSSVTKNHATAGRIPSGAFVEKETKTDLGQESISILLNSNDFTTASRAAKAINDKLDGQFCTATDANRVVVNVPRQYLGNTAGLIATIESAELITDTSAKLIVNERTGTIIIGGSARISPCVVSHGSLFVEITAQTDVSQPNPLSEGQTTTTQNTVVNVTEQTGHVMELSGGASIDELVQALNALQVTPRDLIAILQAIKEAGALQGQLEVI